MTNYSDKLGAKGLTQAEVDARVVAVAPAIATSRTILSGTINDDSVFTIDFPSDTYGSIVVNRYDNHTNRGLFIFSAAATPLMTAIQSTSITRTTGVLTGTTGADGALTISAHSDNKVYFENRLGGPINLVITLGSTTAPN